MNRLVYIADPMCSWCYGFVPEMIKLLEHYENKIRFSIIMGGLRPGGGTPWDQKMKDFLVHHWEEIETKTNQSFGFKLFEKEHFNYDTEPACRAVVVIRDLIPEKTFLFYKSIQHHFYKLNNDPNELDFYLVICDELNIDKEKFKANFLSEAYKEKTRKDFAYSRQLGIRGFPSLVLWSGETVRLVTHGYTEFEKMKTTIDGMLG